MMFTGLHAYGLTGLLARGWQGVGKGLVSIWQVYGKLNQGFGLGKFLATTVLGKRVEHFARNFDAAVRDVILSAKTFPSAGSIPRTPCRSLGGGVFPRCGPAGA